PKKGGYLLHSGAVLGCVLSISGLGGIRLKSKVEPGDTLLLIDSKGKKWMVQASLRRTLSTHRGEISLQELIGTPYGASVRTKIGERVWLARPTCEDFIMKSRRPTQIVYPKDMGILLTRSGIGPGSLVVEGGTGSGALATLLAWFVRPNGHVFSYETRRDFIETAARNLGRAGLLDYVTLKEGDVTAGVDEADAQAFFLDIGDPWRAIPVAHRSLIGGAVLSVITPTYNQVEKTAESMKGMFTDIQTVEILMRNVLVRRGRTRPGSRMIGHTAFLTTGRKTVG
ncbi:MAG: tRNA (adenine-N1)-methyltransferase, partial [Candidatus Geothermarchaeales archaeon]